MNIFILDSNPKIAASFHCDEHVRKMVIEAAQMLNSNSIVLGGTSFKRDYPPYTNYKTCYINHPCSIWARKSKANSIWLIEYGLALALEFKKRYHKEHKCKRVIEWVKDFGTIPTSGELTPFVVCVKDSYKRDDPVISYKLAYAFDKARFASWNKSVLPPAWFKPYQSLYK